MRTFGQVVQIQIIACRSLNKLIAADGEKRDQAWKAGGLAAVLAAMEMRGWGGRTPRVEDVEAGEEVTIRLADDHEA